MGTVSYHAAFTRNMDNYESLKLGIGVEDEPRGEETFAQAYERVKKFVEDRLLAEVSALEEQIGGIRK